MQTTIYIIIQNKSICSPLKDRKLTKVCYPKKKKKHVEDQRKQKISIHLNLLSSIQRYFFMLHTPPSMIIVLIDLDSHGALTN